MSAPQQPSRTGHVRRDLFLGVEGGATRTVAIVGDAEQREIARAELGPANLQLLSDPELRRILLRLRRSLPRPQALCIGLAGFRSQSDAKRVLNAATEVWPETPCHACSDLDTAMAAAASSSEKPSRARVLVLSGTGSCCYARATDGRIARVGGWGHLLGDKGSGYEIGLRALKAVIYRYDCDGDWPKLGEALLRHLQLNSPNDLVRWVRDAGKQDLAALAPEVFAAWAKRDKIASDILQAAAHSLTRDAVACLKRLVKAGSPVTFVLAGGVLLNQPRFAKLVSRQLLALWPNATVSLLKRESAWGAVRLAQEVFESGGMPRPFPPGASGSVGNSLPPDQAQFPIPRALGLSPTERRNPRSTRLDQLPVKQAIAVMLKEEARVAPLLLKQNTTIARCIGLIVSAFRRGGRLFYVGAGSSGRIGALDASECPPTFRAAAEQVQAIMAGGQRALWQSLEGAEDDAIAGAEAIHFRGVTQQDVVVGIAASGRTPFIWGALAAAKTVGAKTIFVCFNPLIEIVPEAQPDLLLAIDLGPEVLTGSTRLKAGTATKLVLNLFTTLSMVQLGKVVSNLMVDLNPSNVKLRDRAVRIVRELTKVSEADAARALERSNWVIKQALQRLKRV